MQTLPLHHNFTDRRCLVVGGGTVAHRRIRRLTDAGARVDVVAMTVGDAISATVSASGGTVTVRAFEVGDVHADYALVVAATDDREVNRAVAAAARECKVPVNVVDDAALCDVIFPLAIDRDPITISIASGVASPSLTRLLGMRIANLIPNEYGALATLVRRYRKPAEEKIPNAKTRAQFWDEVLRGTVAEHVFSGRTSDAEKLLSRALNNFTPQQKQNTVITGEVYLIGAGPGDPELLTLRALRLLQQSDVVLYDRLVSPEILSRIPPATEKVYVGKQRAQHSTPQQNINQLLIDHARSGKRVARLKGGDPFIFGRGGEEIAQLAAEQIPFQVIPGITAAAGCASYAGIPLTHRDHAQSVRFITGQLQDGSVNLDWQSLTAPDQTLVFYMSLNGLPVICENLTRFGMPPTTPIAIIQKGTTPEQQTHITTLGDLPVLLNTQKLHPPTIVIIGSVVSLHNQLNWFTP